MKVSVVIITRNEQTYIKDLLDSLVTQTIPPYEIIIIDAESTDDTQRMVRQAHRHLECLNQVRDGAQIHFLGRGWISAGAF